MQFLLLFLFIVVCLAVFLNSAVAPLPFSLSFSRLHSFYLLSFSLRFSKCWSSSWVFFCAFLASVDSRYWWVCLRVSLFLCVCVDAIMQSGCILRSVQGTFLVGYHWKVHSSWTCSLYVHSMCERDEQCTNWAKSKLTHRHIIDVPYINHGYGYAQYTYVFIVVIVVVVVIIRMILSIPFLTCN